MEARKGADLCLKIMRYAFESLTYITAKGVRLVRVWLIVNLRNHTTAPDAAVNLFLDG
jgi:hypothetical protein